MALEELTERPLKATRLRGKRGIKEGKMEKGGEKEGFHKVGDQS